MDGQWADGTAEEWTGRMDGWQIDCHLSIDYLTID